MNYSIDNVIEHRKRHPNCIWCTNRIEKEFGVIGCKLNKNEIPKDRVLKAICCTHFKVDRKVEV